VSRTIKFVLIVSLVSGVVSFLLTALTAGSATRTSPTFVSVVFGMVAGIAYLLLTGNRKVPVADEATRRRALVELTPTDGSARLLLVRQVSVGVMVGVDVTVDGTLATQLKSPRFAIVPITPGTHEIVAVAQGRSTKPLAIDVAAGEIAVVRLSAGLGGIKLTREADSPQLRTALEKVPMVGPLDAAAAPVA